MIRADDAERLVKNAAVSLDKIIHDYLKDTCAPIVERAARTGCRNVVLPVAKDMDPRDVARVLHRDYLYLVDIGSVHASKLNAHTNDPYATREWARWPFVRDAYGYSSQYGVQSIVSCAPVGIAENAIAEEGTHSEEVVVPAVRICLTGKAVQKRSPLNEPQSLFQRFYTGFCCCWPRSDMLRPVQCERLYTID